MKNFFSTLIIASLIFLATASPGQAQEQTKTSVTQPANPLDRWDPLGGFNRRVYRFNANFDRWVVMPLVRGYRFIFPSFARTGFQNFFANIDEVTVFSNSVLQLAPKKAVGTLARTVINTTFGLAGLWDPATRVGLKAYNEDFGQTLGHYGVPPGPYLVVPLLGPSSLREGTGQIADRLLIWGVEYAILGDLQYVFSALYPAEILVSRNATNFIYGELGPFEYELVRYFFMEYREALVED
ncbi:MAG: hypothetical protein CBC48_12845 [bacterium TMED88]|nr:ABC transporter [Deltaproteobacteria bacterium]OUV28626.1 MAG: hypothetical protein CBC48_12845 [bacterium TMED88]